MPASFSENIRKLNALNPEDSPLLLDNEEEETLTERKNYAKLEEKLLYRFKDIRILKKALTHSSCKHTSGHKAWNNERMEFLGDAVLELTISDALLRLSPPFTSEGQLTLYRSRLVNKSSLYQVASSLELSCFVQVGEAEKEAHIHKNHALLADTLEALFAGIFLDGGFDASYRSIMHLFREKIERTLRQKGMRNFKGELQQWLQKQKGEKQNIPRYQVEEERGPQHKKEYTVSCRLEGQVLGRGKGMKKKEAEQKAAEQAMIFLNLIKPSSAPSAPSG